MHSIRVIALQCEIAILIGGKIGCFGTGRNSFAGVVFEPQAWLCNRSVSPFCT